MLRRSMFATVMVTMTVAVFPSACGIADVDAESGRRTQALPAGALLPNIVEEPPFHLGIQNAHQRESLRFTTTHWNDGAGPLQIRGGGQIAPCDIDGVHFDQCTHATQEILDANGNIVATQPAGHAIFHEAHNHWHQSDVANFRVHAGSLDGPIVSSSDKVTFCLIDFEDSQSPKRDRVYWECNGDLQGISAGFGDEYHQSTEGQELDITGVPEGIYYLVFTGDPTGHWLESSEGDNSSWAKFRLSRKGANPEITVLETSPCSGIACGNTANK